MSDPEFEEFAPNEYANNAINGIFDLVDEAKEGNQEAARHLLNIASFITQMVTSPLTGGVIPGANVDERMTVNLPPSVRSYIIEHARNSVSWPVMVTNRKRFSVPGVLFHPDDLKAYLEMIELGGDLNISEEPSHSDPEISKFVAHLYRELQYCCDGHESVSDHQREMHPHIDTIFEKVGLLPRLSRNGLDRTSWIASADGKRWKNALTVFLPIFFKSDQWQNEEMFRIFEFSAKDKAGKTGKTGKPFSDKYFQNFILGKLLAGLHSIAGK